VKRWNIAMFTTNWGHSRSGDTPLCRVFSEPMTEETIECVSRNDRYLIFSSAYPEDSFS
jgi:hypothetical protein